MVVTPAPHAPDSARIASVAAALDGVRGRVPLVQNITNFVSMDVVANVLLAIGAAPAMVHAHEEVEEFGAHIGALVCNIGTLSPAWVDAMEHAAGFARRRATPWVLDPVGAGATSLRDRAVERLLTHRPTIIRGNASEILAVAHVAGVSASAAAPRGVDSAHTTDQAGEVAHALARDLGCVVVASGAIDLVTDGTRGRRLANGSPMMARVTALGCALSAVCGAFATVEDDAFEAACAAVGIFGVAGEIAAAQAAGPGSFRVAFLDALANLDVDALGRLREVE